MVSTTTPRQPRLLRPGERRALDRAEAAGYLVGGTPGAVAAWTVQDGGTTAPPSRHTYPDIREEVGVDVHL